MIKALKRKFIIFLCLIIFVISQIIAISIMAFNYYNLVNRLDNNLDTIAIKSKDDFFHEQRNQRYFVINVIDGNPILNTRESRDNTITEDNFLEYYNNANSEKGYSSNYRYKVYESNQEGRMYIFLNSYIELSIFINNSITVEIVLLLASLIIMILMILLSNKMFKSTIETYEKQKEFITNASHELKTPLTIICANNELIKYEYNDEKYTSVIDNQIDKLNNLIKQMIQQAKVDEEKNIVKKEFNISDTSLDTINIFSSLVEKENKKLNYSISPNITYLGDETLYRQLLSILLDNANKYCDNDGVIEFLCYKEKKIYISVKNSFKDVDRLNLDKLFDRFYRFDEARTSNNSYGLGLSIALGIVKKHGGSIKAIRHEATIEFLIAL